jgi:hypothetical protein
MEDFSDVTRLVGRLFRETFAEIAKGGREMPEDRDKLQGQNDEPETDDVEAHRLQANDEPDAQDDDVEAHRLQANDEPDAQDDDVEAHRLQ